MKKGLEPAFAAMQINEHSNVVYKGMSKRFYAACAAMQGILANPNPDIISLNSDEVADLSLKYADKLLKQEEAE